MATPSSLDQNDADGTDGTTHSRKLAQCRLSCLEGRVQEASELLTSLSSQDLSPDEAFLLEVLMLYPGVASANLSDSQLLQAALRLQSLAQEVASPFSQACSWEITQMIQIRLQLYYAALHSTAMAVELFESCGRKFDAINMQISSCQLMIYCEMYREVLNMSTQILAARQFLHPIALCNILRSTASANYFLGIEAPDDLARTYWEQSLRLHEEYLAIAESNAFQQFVLIAHTNIAIVNAWLGRSAATNLHLSQIQDTQSTVDIINASRPYWLRFCRILLQCQNEDNPQEVESGWHALRALADELRDTNLMTAAVQDAVLRNIVKLGSRRGDHVAALQASQAQVELSNKRRRVLCQTLGETVDDVMSVPKLKQKNQELSVHGDQLENSLARRNVELSQALDELRAEAAIRLVAENALKNAHEHLEDEVRQRSTELENAMRVMMRQEKQLALGRLVVGVAHELNTPLGNATLAASSIAEIGESLQQDLQGTSLSRSKLQASIGKLMEGGEILKRALKTSGNLVQRFRALAIEQHEEQLVEFNLSERFDLILANWHERFAAQGIIFTAEIQQNIFQTGYPNALYQVIDQLIENAMKHALKNGPEKTLKLRLQLAEGRILIAVEDNGIGIDSAIISRVFEPFFSKRLGNDGIGLGLSIVHNLVTELMQGSITIAPQTPRGTVVKLLLPKSLRP